MDRCVATGCDYGDSIKFMPFNQLNGIDRQPVEAVLIFILKDKKCG